MDRSSTLDEAQLRLLSVVYDWYRTKHLWPSLTAIALLLDKEDLDVEAVMASIPTDILGRPYYPGVLGHGTLTLSLRGMALLPEAAPDLDLLIVAICASWDAASAIPPESLLAQEAFGVTSEQMDLLLRERGVQCDQPSLV